MKAAKRDACSSRHKKLNDLCDLCLTLPCSNKMIGVSQPRAANWKVTHALITAEWGEGWVVSSGRGWVGAGGLGGHGLGVVLYPIKMYLACDLMLKEKLLSLMIELVVILNHLGAIHLWRPQKNDINRHCLQYRSPYFFGGLSEVVETTLPPPVSLSYLRG